MHKYIHRIDNKFKKVCIVFLYFLFCLVVLTIVLLSTRTFLVLVLSF